MTFSVRRLTRLGLRDILIGGMLLVMLATQGLPALRAAAQDGGGEPRAVMSDAFTYQGRLVKDGVPAEGAHDFEFALYDAHSGGNLLQTLPVLTGVPVTNGVFTVQLAFASLQFQGQQRFLEVRSRPAGGGAFTVMGRQELTATPYALYAKATDWNGVANKPAGFTDGVDNDTTYTATSPLALSGNLFTFSTSGCNADYVWKYNGAGWQCVPDGGTWANITAKPIGFADNVDNDTLGSLAGCTNGQIAKYNGSAWSCQDGNHFGETWTGNADNALGDGSGLVIDNTDTTGAPSTIVAEAHGGGFALTARNLDGGTGVRAIQGNNCFGVFAPTAVMGTSCNGYGVIGTSSTQAGVWGLSSAAGKTGAGVIAENLGTSSDCPSASAELLDHCFGLFGIAATGAGSIGVYGRGNHIGVSGEGGTWAGFFTGNVGVTGACCAASDLRLKRDVVPLGAGLEAVLDLRPVTFRWLDEKADGDQVHYGLIAQDVQKILPDLVPIPDDPDAPLMIDQIGLIPVLINALQQQQAEIESLQGQFNAGSADSGANAPAPSNAAPSGAGHDPLTWVALAFASVAVLGWLVLGWKWRAAPVGARVRPHSPA